MSFSRQKGPIVTALSDEQTKFVDDMSTKCHQLLTETHPNGPHFANTIKVIREIILDFVN